MRLSEADALYSVARTCTAARTTIECSALQQFVSGSHSLLRAVGNAAEDPLWAPVIRRIRRARWDLNSLPLPMDHHDLELAASARLLRRLLRGVEDAYPRLAGQARLIEAQLAQLAGLSISPLGEHAAQLLRAAGSSHAAALIRQGRMAPAAAAWLRKQGLKVQVLAPEQLAGTGPLEVLVVIGPSRWYPAHLLTAPRAESLQFVHYAWIRDSPPEPRLFPGSAQRSCTRPIRHSPRPAGDQDLDLDAEELLPPIDWAALSASVGGAESPDDPDTIEACLFMLAGGNTVFLETDDDATIDMIDLDAEGPRVCRERIRSLHPGAYILLRSIGSAGDYIHAIADSHLGTSAPALRRRQSEWKDLLRSRVESRGLAAVVADLKRAGVRAARAGNVRYWMAPESIKTRRPEDFLILMQYVGLGEQARSLWAAMDRISDAHMWAGQEIRRLLEAQVAGSDLDKLKRQGWLDVELEGTGAGMLTIFRVDGKAPDHTLVPASWLRRPEEVERDLWQG
jgi:hypothetical protein